MSTANDSRRRELAMIHIAAKQIGLDEEAYRQVVRDIGGAASGSSADLSPLARERVLQHFKSKGWKPKRKPAAKRVSNNGDIMASLALVTRIRQIWEKMDAAGVIENRTEQGLRAWVKSASRRYHPNNSGYSAPEFLPEWVAQRLVEHLKKWAARCGVSLNE